MKMLFVVMAALFISYELRAAEVGPHGGNVVADDTHKYEVKIDKDKGVSRIDVYTLQAKKDQRPGKMKVTLFRDPETSQTITLEAMDNKDLLPHYQGQLAPAAGSIAGVQLTFEVNMKDLKVLKLIPYIPPTGVASGKSGF